MLFQRLYNWIKYKTLPSSFLFKNRLFIERDSKHRRVLSNFGLSFRNSKWSNYETYNIKLQFRKSYFKFIFWIFFFIFTILFLYYFKKYYIIIYFFNNLIFFFWISIDTFDYYLSFLVWFFTISFSLFFNLIYSYFFFNNFSNNSSSKKNFSNHLFAQFPLNSSFSSKDLYVSKHDLNWLLYSWLTNPNTSKNTVILESLFENNVNKAWWDKYHDFFIKLYKLSYLLNISSEKYTTFFINNKLNVFSNFYYKGHYTSTLNYFINNSSLNNYSSLLFYYFINNYKNYFQNKQNLSSSLNFIKNRYEWNLYNFNTELDAYPFLLKNKLGMFFLDNLNYQKFSYFIFNFNELWSLNLFFKNQTNSSKWNRWLYRYSILHRKILKFSHKITLSKRLLNSGFYDSKIFNKNIWANEHLNNISSNDNFSSFFSNMYPNIFSINNSDSFDYKMNYINNGSQKDSLNLLNFYENSYFWYLKRFYLFNSLSTNLIKSKMIKNDNSFNINLFSEKDPIQNKYSIFISYLLKSSYMNLNLFSHSRNNYFNNSEFYNNSNNYFNNFKDIYMLSNDNDLLTRDNLNFFYWITNSLSKNNNLVFFNYLNFIKKSKMNINVYFLNNLNKDSNNLNFWLAYSLINLDKTFLNDVVYLSLFN